MKEITRGVWDLGRDRFGRTMIHVDADSWDKLSIKDRDPRRTIVGQPPRPPEQTDTEDEEKPA
jgi:hypothetical protein